MQWERPLFKFLPSYNSTPSDKLQAIETSLKGMEMALASTASLPQISKDQQLKDDIFALQHQLGIRIREDNPKFLNDYMTDTTLQSLHVPQRVEDLPSFFFLFCLKLLHDGTLGTPRQESELTVATEQNASSGKDQEVKRSTIQNFWAMNVSSEKVVIALKCSLTLGLAVFLGLLFSKDDGYWAGLTVAITFAPSREATFSLASSRAHGTALGSFFGVLGSLVSQNLMEVRLLMLVPWLVFTSFLQRSRMYGQGGAVCAALSAMIIIGRRSYGNPIMFTINRLTETYVGLCCAIFVELLLQPTRASTLARLRLSNSLQALCECIGSMTGSEDLNESEKKLRKVVCELKKFILEAELEPNFWFLPFPSACYNKLHSSISKAGDLLLFMGHSMELLIQESCEIEEAIKQDLDRFKELLGTSAKCLGEAIQVESQERVDKVGCSESDDIELGRGSQSPWAKWGVDEEGCEEIVACILRRAEEIVEKVDEDVSGGEVRSQLVLCFAAIGFCMQGLVREVGELEKGILELVQWEKPTSCAH